jgi:predicted transcriptional regulator of viral defense system
MPKNMELVQRLLSLGKPYFTLADLEKVLGQSRPGLYVTLNRLVSYGMLVRLRRGVYQVALQSPALARIANTLVYPSYLSFESALSRYGILSQVPYVLTFATPKRSRRLTLGGTAIRYHQLKDTLFFGYGMSEGLYVAEPEKALLDQCYLSARGLADLAWDELDLSSISQDRLTGHAAHFPPVVQARIQKFVTADH